MRKTYRIKKDLPDLKAGCLFNWSDNNNVYEALNSKTPYIGGHETFYVFSHGTVEGQPEWFEEVESQEESQKKFEERYSTKLVQQVKEFENANRELKRINEEYQSKLQNYETAFQEQFDEIQRLKSKIQELVNNWLNKPNRKKK